MFLRLTSPFDRSILEVDDLKDSSVHLKEAVWMKDKDVTDCFNCEKPFSVSRRKVSPFAQHLP
jgi:hypothetical protein